MAMFMKQHYPMGNMFMYAGQNNLVLEYSIILLPVTDINDLLCVGFKTYKACKETAVRKEIWKLIGYIDLEKENISFPDLAVFLSYNKELFIKQSQAMRHGNLIKIPINEYLALLKKGYIYGFFDNYQTFELWLSGNIENYPENDDIFPLPEKYS